MLFPKDSPSALSLSLASQRAVCLQCLLSLQYVRFPAELAFVPLTQERHSMANPVWGDLTG